MLVKNDGWRMYFFVMYNLSGIQKGIQAGHAALEYAEMFFNTWEYKEFINNHKTFIVLSGGGSQDMILREQELKNLGFNYAVFTEPDLNMSRSAIAFLVPENIYNFKLGEEDLVNQESPLLVRYNYLRGFNLASN